MSSTTMACKREERIFFSSTSCCFFIFFFFFFFQSCYKGSSLHDYKFKNTQECIAQMLTSKPMYKESKCMWGCITQCRFYTTIKPCVCVCMLPRPKASRKSSFGAVRCFLLPKLRNSELHNLQLVSGVPFPLLTLLLVLVIIVLVVATVQEYGKKKQQ